MAAANVPPGGKGPTVKGGVGNVETATAAVLPSVGSAILQVAPGVMPSMVVVAGDVASAGMSNVVVAPSQVALTRIGPRSPAASPVMNLVSRRLAGRGWNASVTVTAASWPGASWTSPVPPVVTPTVSVAPSSSSVTSQETGAGMPVSSTGGGETSPAGTTSISEAPLHSRPGSRWGRAARRQYP